MVKRYWAAAVNDIETNPCLVEGWVPVHLSSDYDALTAELAIEKSVKNINRIANDSARAQLEYLEAVLRDVNMICAQAPPIEDMEDIDKTYNQILDDIQTHCRNALPQSETEAKCPGATAEVLGPPTLPELAPCCHLCGPGNYHVPRGKFCQNKDGKHSMKRTVKS